MYKKKQLLEMVKILEQTNNSVKNWRYVENTAIIDALTECQELAVEIGNDLESRGEAFRKAVSLLEEYCEDIYQLSMAEELEDRNQFIRDIEDKLGQLETIIQCELPEDKKKVVFLPYKAAMWDSLESIYLSMKDDDKYEAYVMPIPYYDKNEDGSFGKMHYEGSEFPKNIPITSWEEYSLEEERPDIVYIHNPYDNWNIVTSIHPMFYASELKKYTEELVYVPYFVLEEIEPDNQAAIDEMSHFIKTPAVLFADKVIVQSEKMKQIYVNEFLKWAKEMGLHGRNVDRSYQESRILGTGSPKIEKILHTKREDLDIPEEWLNKIMKPDGGRKKIIFYNTSIGALLYYKEKMLAKMKEVFSYFKQNQEELLLLWRPHPLILSTIKSMLPELLEEYQSIVEQYKKENWGIFDISADMDRAIVLSDIYYGDRSSLVILYQAMYKPIIIQNADMPILCFENFIYLNGYLWFSAQGFNGLFRLKDGEAEADFAGCFLQERDIGRLYIDIVAYENCLIFVPLFADSIAVYCTDTGEFIRIPIDVPKENGNRFVKYENTGKFTTCIVHKENAFFFPSTYPAILRLDLRTYKIEYLYEPIKKLTEELRFGSYYFRRGVQQGEEVCLWCPSAGALIKFNMNTYTMKMCCRIQEDKLYKEAVYDGKYYWLLPFSEEADIIKISEDGREQLKIKLPNEVKNGNMQFVEAFVRENEIWMFPATAKEIIKIDIKTNQIHVEDFINNTEIEGYKGNIETDWKFFFAKQIDEKIYAYHQFSYKLFIKDEKRNLHELKSIISNTLKCKLKEPILDLINQHFSNNKSGNDLIMYEGGRMTLSSYMEMIDVILEKMQEKEIGNSENGEREL